MSRTQSRVMFAKVTATKAANDTARQEQAQFRLSDPLELAKAYLRQRGWHVFAENVLTPRSDLIVVGRTAMPANDVIAMAERIRAR